MPPFFHPMRLPSLPALCAITLTFTSCSTFQKEKTAEYDPAGGQQNAYEASPAAPGNAYGAPSANPYSQSNLYSQPATANPYGQQPAANPYTQPGAANAYGSYETPQTFPAQSGGGGTGGGAYQKPYVQTDSRPSYSGGASSSASSGGAGGTHTVVSGDTLSGLARKYKKSVSAIKQANGMTNDTVVLGKKTGDSMTGGAAGMVPSL